MKNIYKSNFIDNILIRIERKQLIIDKVLKKIKITHQNIGDKLAKRYIDMNLINKL